MSIDYGERERQFLETLKADSGRALDEWMAAIAAQGLTQRNDIIDWLRRQGFMFSKASWLERIHNNGGRPIYAEAGTRRPQPRAPTTPPPARPRLMLVPQASPPAAAPRPIPPPPPAAPPPQAQNLPPAPPPPVAGQADPAALDVLLARAKAFRPLAVYVVAEIRKAVPGVAVIAQDGYVVFRSGTADFALLTINAKELRLGLALRSTPATAPLEAAKLPGLRSAPAMTHMAVLTDARQITPALLAAIAQAASGP